MVAEIVIGKGSDAALLSLLLVRSAEAAGGLLLSLWCTLLLFLILSCGYCCFNASKASCVCVCDTTKKSCVQCVSEKWVHVPPAHAKKLCLRCSPATGAA